jgi:ribosomal protein S4
MKYFCSHCKKEIDYKTYLYSKKHFNKPLCRKHQFFDYNLIKGRVAESLIEQLFIRLNFRVYRYGMENTIPGIMELLQKNSSEVNNVIRRMPDFVVQNNDGKAYFIEVKFRSSEMFSIDDIEKEYGNKYPFENAFFIVVSKNHIKCLSYNQLQDGKKIYPKCHNYLGHVKAFETDKDIIIKFCKYAVKFFANVK